MNRILSPKIAELLASLDTCSVANAVDASGVRLANEGFSDNRISCLTPRLRSTSGFVFTMKVRSAEPPMKRTYYLDHPDWWELLKAEPGPRVLVLEDIDARPGRGSLVGPVHACILKALGFVGVVTNGAIRGRSSFERIGMGAYAGNVAPAHAFSHVVEVGVTVEVAGLRLSPGDFVHGDESGVVAVPPDAVEKTALAAEEFHQREKRICEFCNSPEFSPASLRAKLGVDESRR